MDDILKRLGAVESSVAETRVQVSAITAVIPHLPTKEDLSEVRDDLNEVRAQVSGISTTIPHLATKADVLSMETAIIKWIIATVIATAGVAFAIAKFVH